MAPDADIPLTDPQAETPPSRRRGIGLCLSGGGFRATLFHAGAIQRLFELGIANRPDFDTVASVSGGGLTAAQWATARSLRGSSSIEGERASLASGHAVGGVDLGEDLVADAGFVGGRW